MMSGPNTKLYLDKKNGQIEGLCAGLAEHFGMDVTLVRMIALASVFVTGGGSVIGYYIMVHYTDRRPDEVEQAFERQDGAKKQFWQKVRRNPHASARQIRARFRDLDRRLSAAEIYLTSPDKRLAREIDRLR